jgi:hypothetical protein
MSKGVIMQTINREQFNKILADLPQNADENLVHKTIKDYLFNAEYKKTLMEKSDKICKFLKTGSYKWIQLPTEEQLIISCNVDLVSQEQLILINDCIMRFFNYYITPINADNKLSIIFTENLSHKEVLRELFKING